MSVDTKRMRELANAADGITYYTFATNLREAADEVDKLREEAATSRNVRAALRKDVKLWNDACEVLADENVNLREFASYVMHGIWDADMDDGSAQDKAEALGLIELRPIDEADSIDGEDEHYFLVWE